MSVVPCTLLISIYYWFYHQNHLMTSKCIAPMCSWLSSPAAILYPVDEVPSRNLFLRFLIFTQSWMSRWASQQGFSVATMMRSISLREDSASCSLVTSVVQRVGCLLSLIACELGPWGARLDLGAREVMLIPSSGSSNGPHTPHLER